MKLTGYIILIGGIILSLYDLWAMLNGVSISGEMSYLLLGHPVVVFTMGFICGHWLGSEVYVIKKS